MKSIYNLILLMLLLASCEQTIDLDMPHSEPKIVVDGYIETDLPPYIFLSRTSGYFDPVNSGLLINDAVSGAVVRISDGVDTVQLSELIGNGILLGGVYAAIDSVTQQPLMTGIPGRSYKLWIETIDGQSLYSEVKLPLPVALDSVWFRLNEDSDSLGIAYGRLNEPDTLGNCYRWFARRQGKDELFLAPLGSSFEDRFINGKSFDLFYNRGSIRNSEAEDDQNEEAGLFKKSDTIIVKFTAVDRAVFEFWRDAETQLSNNGSPFAIPSNIKSNIRGGIGLFAAYAPVYDTILPVP